MGNYSPLLAAKQLAIARDDDKLVNYAETLMLESTTMDKDAFDTFDFSFLKDSLAALGVEASQQAAFSKF